MSQQAFQKIALDFGRKERKVHTKTGTAYLCGTQGVCRGILPGERHGNMEKMKQLFDYFESADEAVYVSDVETYDLIYMNRQLKKILGYPMELSCEGMKCYKVLQNEDKPCAFCNNQELLAGDFKTWVHENPVVDHRFLIKDKAVECEGRHYRVEVATEMSKAVLDAAKRYFTQQEKVL